MLQTNSHSCSLHCSGGGLVRSCSAASVCALRLTQLRRHRCGGYASSFTVLPRQLSESARGAVLYNDDVPLHHLRPFVATTPKKGFRSRSVHSALTDGDNATPEAELGTGLSSGGSMPGEGSVEDDNMGKAGRSSSQMQSKYTELNEVAVDAQLTQVTLHTCGTERAEPNCMSYLAGQGFTSADLEALQGEYPAVTKLEAARVELVFEFLRELGLSGSQVIKLVREFPRVVSYSVGDKMRPLVEWLVQHGVDRSKVGRILAKSPQIVNRSIESNLQPKVEWLLQFVDKSKIGRIVTQHPQLLRLSIESNLQPKVEWLLQYVDESKIGKILTRHPQILGYSIESNLRPTVEWLLQYVDKSKIGKIVTQHPQILGYSIESNLQPTMEWLVQYVDKSEIGSILTKCPQLLCLSITSNMQPKLDHLVGLGLKHENKHKVLRTSVISLSFETINAKLDVLRHQYALPEHVIQNLLNNQPRILEHNLLANFHSYLAVGLTRGEIRSMVMKDSTALIFNVLNGTYNPKLRYYLDVVQYKIQDIAEYPRLLHSALEKIVSRMEAVVQHGSTEYPTPKEFLGFLDMSSRTFSERFKPIRCW